MQKGKAREEDGDNTLKEQFWKSLRNERLKNATRVKFELIKSFELLRRAVRAEENEMKVATNLPQQQLKQQKKEEEPKEEKLDLIMKRIEEKGRKKGVGMPTRPKRDRITNNSTMGKIRIQSMTKRKKHQNRMQNL